MKVSIEDVEKALRESKIPVENIKTVVTKLEEAVEANKSDKDSKPRSKNQFVVVAFDSTGQIKTDISAIVGQIEDGVNPSVVLDRIKNAAKAFNSNTRKGRKNPVRSISEAVEAMPRKFFKVEKLLIKTSSPVLVVKSDNSL